MYNYSIIVIVSKGNQQQQRRKEDKKTAHDQKGGERNERDNRIIRLYLRYVNHDSRPIK